MKIKSVTRLISILLLTTPLTSEAQTVTLGITGLGTEVKGEVAPGATCLTGTGAGTSRTCTYGGWRSDFTPLVGIATHACSCNTGYTFISISPGETCTYGGIQPVLVLPNGSTSNQSTHCFPGNTGPQGDSALVGEIIDATGTIIPGSRKGRKHELNTPNIGWDIIIWSEQDHAYWPVNPKTGDIWPETTVGIEIGQGVYHLNNTCEGPLYVPYTPDNRVVWDATGTIPYKAGGSYPSISSEVCSSFVYGYCYIQLCPGDMLLAIEAEYPPSLNSFTPPFKGGQ